MTEKEQKEVIRVVRGLLRVARMAMPDTYWQTDRRVNAARRLMKKLGVTIK